MRTIKARLENAYLFTLVVYLMLCLLTSQAFPANTDHESDETSAYREIKAIRTETPPKIDGKLDEYSYRKPFETPPDLATCDIFSTLAVS